LFVSQSHINHILYLKKTIKTLDKNLWQTSFKAVLEVPIIAEHTKFMMHEQEFKPENNPGSCKNDQR